VDADFSATQTAEELFRPIRAGTVQSAGFLVVDPFDFETLMQVVPCPALSALHQSPRRNTDANEGGSLAFRTENGRNRVPAVAGLH